MELTSIQQMHAKDQGSKSVLDYFSDFAEVVKMLVQPTPKDYAADMRSSTLRDLNIIAW